MKKILLLIISILIISGCTKIEENEFQKIYDTKIDYVKELNYQELLEFTETKTGIIFIGDENDESQKLADRFCDVLCECDVDIAYFIKEENLNKEEFLSKIEAEELKFPAILVFKLGDLIKYYDENIETEDINNYIDSMFHEVYPVVCDEVC